MKKKGHAWKQAPSPTATLSLLLGSSVAPNPAPPPARLPQPHKGPPTSFRLPLPPFLSSPLPFLLPLYLVCVQNPAQKLLQIPGL